MPTLLVGYDLNRDGQNYEKLIARLKEYDNWWHHLDSTWIIKTGDSAVQVRDTLGALVDSNDEILVVALTGVGAWKGFNTEGSDWLKANL